jgi:hypothetical protein
MQWLIPGLISAGFIGLGLFLLTKEIRFSLGQATAKANVIGKDFYLDNTIGPGWRLPGFYLLCEVGAMDAKPACQGTVRINLFSWLTMQNGQQIDVRYNRSDARDMRLSRSLGNWPACVFLFVVGGIQIFMVIKALK